MIWPGVSILPTTGPFLPDMDEVDRLRGVSFMQPYASSIVDGPKRYENRPNAVPKHLSGRALWMAVHAGLGWYGGADEAIPRWRAAPRADHRSPDYRAWPSAPVTRTGYPKSAILGFARVVGCVDFAAEQRIADGSGTNPARAMLARAWLSSAATRAWAFGPMVVVLDPTVLRLPKPIPIPRGALGWWSLDDRRVEMPPELQAEVRRALVSCLHNRATWRTAA